MSRRQRGRKSEVVVKVDPLVASMEANGDVFYQSIKEHLRRVAGELTNLCVVRAMGEDASTTEKANCSDKVAGGVRTLQKNTVTILQHAVKYQQRLEQQTKTASNKIDKLNQYKPERVKKAKSEARRAAGRQKVASLVQWQNDMRDAKQELRIEEHDGSLRLKKGSPLYNKIQSMQRAHLLNAAPGEAAGRGVAAAPSSASASASAVAGGEQPKAMASSSAASSSAREAADLPSSIRPAKLHRRLRSKKGKGTE